MLAQESCDVADPITVSNSTLEMNLTTLPAPWAAPTGEQPIIGGTVALIPDCDWESKFSEVVDSICNDYTGELPSFLDLTWD